MSRPETARRPGLLLLAAVAGVALLTPGCALLDKQRGPTPNLSATRASGSAPVRATTPTSPVSPAVPSASPTTGAPPGSTRPSALGTAAPLTATSWGPVTHGAPATSGAEVAWLDACQGWALRSSGGSVVGHAKTRDGGQGSAVFAIRIDDPAVPGPGGIRVGAPASEFQAVHPQAQRGDSAGVTFLFTTSGPTTFVAQLDKRDVIVALMVLPPGQTAADFSGAPLCR